MKYFLHEIKNYLGRLDAPNRYIVCRTEDDSLYNTTLDKLLQFKTFSELLDCYKRNIKELQSGRFKGCEPLSKDELEILNDVYSSYKELI